MCIIYGFDVPGWQTSKTFPTACQRQNHHKGCNSTNYLQYQVSGYAASTRKSGKIHLPVNPEPHQMWQVGAAPYFSNNIIKSMSVLHETIPTPYSNIVHDHACSNKCTIVETNASRLECARHTCWSGGRVAGRRRLFVHFREIANISPGSHFWPNLTGSYRKPRQFSTVLCVVWVCVCVCMCVCDL